MLVGVYLQAFQNCCVTSQCDQSYPLKLFYCLDFVSASTTNNDTVQHQSSSPHEEQQEGAEGGNDQTLPKTVEGEIDITPPQGWLPPISRSYIREKSHHF